MNEQKSYQFPSHYDSLSQLESIVMEASRKAGLDEGQYEALMLVASEAMTNAIKHGNKLNEQKHVKVSWHWGAGELQFSVEDEGEGFDAETLPDPLNPENLLRDSGRGVFLMKTYCDDVLFEKGGRRVVLIFRVG